MGHQSYVLLCSKITNFMTSEQEFSERFMGNQSYVLICSKITSFPPSEQEFSEKLGIFSKVKIFQNPSCSILEKMNENYDRK